MTLADHMTRRAIIAEASARARMRTKPRRRIRQPKPGTFPRNARNVYLRGLLDVVDRTKASLKRIIEPALPRLVEQASRARTDAADTPLRRIAVAGGPRTGKTTTAERLAQQLGLPLTHSDDLISLGWSEASDELAKRMAAAERGIYEGVAVVRAIRKLLERSSDKPIDALLILRQPFEQLTDGQRRMSRAQDTVLYEIVPRLHALGVLIAHEAYELEPPPLAPVRTDADDEDLEVLLDEVRSAADRDVQSSTGILAQQTAQRVSAHTRAETESQVGEVLGIDVFSPETGMPEIAQEFVRKQAELIKGLVGKQLDDAREVLAKGLREGWRPESLARALTDAGLSKHRATILANDSVAKLHGTMTMERQTALGIKTYRWLTAGDEKVRPGHKALNGSEQKWSKPPITNPKTGKRAHPGFDTHYFPCRCSAIPVLDDILEQAGIDPALAAPVQPPLAAAPTPQPPIATPVRPPRRPPTAAAPQPAAPPPKPPRPPRPPRSPTPPAPGPSTLPPPKRRPPKPPRPPTEADIKLAADRAQRKQLASDLNKELQALPPTGGDGETLRKKIIKQLELDGMSAPAANTPTGPLHWDLRIQPTIEENAEAVGMRKKTGEMVLREDAAQKLRESLAAIDAGRASTLTPKQMDAISTLAHEEIHGMGAVVGVPTTTGSVPHLIEEAMTETAARVFTRRLLQLEGKALAADHILAMPISGVNKYRAYDELIIKLMDGLRSVANLTPEKAAAALERAAYAFKNSSATFTSTRQMVNAFVDSVPNLKTEQRDALRQMLMALETNATTP